nr:acyl-CoA dehydrogenase family protein [Nakamurella deserti]
MSEYRNHCRIRRELDGERTDGEDGAAMFDMTDDQRAIVEACRDFSDREIAPHALRWDAEKHFPVETLRRSADLGLGGIYIAEEHGGSALSRVDAALIFETLSTGCPTVAAYLSIHNMVGWMIDAHGTVEQRARWLPRLCSMEDLGSYCLTEPGVGSDAGNLTTRAVPTDDGYVLTGVKQFISGAGATDVYIVMARTSNEGSHGISAFVVEKDMPGLSFGPNEAKMGWRAQPTRQVILDEVLVPAANRLGGEGDGFRLAMRGLNGGRINIAACSLGGAQAAFDRAVAYMKQRRAFGSDLTSFQALQFALADMATQLEAARLLLWRAAAALDSRDPRQVELAAMAKKFVTDVGFEVANRALQLHGGYGYLSEYGIEKIVRDLRVHQILEGTNEIMSVIIGRAVSR